MSMLGNALSGLHAANTALLVSGQNVANSAVTGYSRQTTMFDTASGDFNGVKVTSVERVVNRFFNDDIWRTQSDLSHYEGYQSYLGYTEELLGTDSLNINDAIADITAALNSAMANPESSAYRQELIAASQALIQDLAQLNSAVDGQVVKLGKEMNDLAQNANSILSSIADYNEKIGLAFAKGQPTAELEDSREQLITELSGMIGVSTHLRDDGKMDISTFNGAPLMIGNKAAQISATGTDVTVELGNESFVLTDKVAGRLGGLMAANVQVLKPTTDSLNNVVSQLADDVNDALAQGFDLNGDAGSALFTYNPADPLGTIALDPAITIDKLAFTGGEFDGGGVWVPSGGVGDNANLKEIISAFKGQQDSYTNLIGELATSSRQNQSSVRTAAVLNENALLSRDSLSGVNLDEEAANIMHFQQLYQANAKVITTADQLFKTLMNMF